MLWPDASRASGCDLGARPETWPRDLGARCPRSGGADEERRERPPGRERAPQEATPEMGCMGPKDPAWFPATPLGPADHGEALRRLGLDGEAVPLVQATRRVGPQHLEAHRLASAICRR